MPDHDEEIESIGRVAGYGHQLIAIHHHLRDLIDRIRDDLADGAVPDAAEWPRDLQTHCLAFCSALDRHHTGEDAGAFAVIAERFGELRPVIDELMRDHRIVEGALQSLRMIVGSIGPNADTAQRTRIANEVDTVSALLETHFLYEEKKLVSALNALDPTAGSTEELLGISADP